MGKYVYLPRSLYPFNSQTIQQQYLEYVLLLQYFRLCMPSYRAKYRAIVALSARLEATLV